jgi:predicted component of type VI protein secretion system
MVELTGNVVEEESLAADRPFAGRKPLVEGRVAQQLQAYTRGSWRMLLVQGNVLSQSHKARQESWRWHDDAISRLQTCRSPARWNVESIGQSEAREMATFHVIVAAIPELGNASCSVHRWRVHSRHHEYAHNNG